MTHERNWADQISEDVLEPDLPILTGVHTMKLTQTSLSLILVSAIGLSSSLVLADSHGEPKGDAMKSMETEMSGKEKMDDGMKKMDEGMEKMDEAMKKTDEGMEKMDDAMKKADEGMEKMDDGMKKTEMKKMSDG